MILCVAANPSIDRLFAVEQPVPGEIHRPAQLRLCGRKSRIGCVPLSRQPVDLLTEVALQFIDDLRGAAEGDGQRSLPLPNVSFRIRHDSSPTVWSALRGPLAIAPSAPPGHAFRQR